MPVYFFDLNDNGRLFSDPIGSHLADDSLAQREAISTLFDLIRTTASLKRRKIEIMVRDVSGRAIYKTELEFVDEVLD